MKPPLKCERNSSGAILKITPRRVTSIVGVVLLLLCIAASAITMVPPPKIQQLAGAWIGPEEQTAYFRLDLDKTGRGLLVIQEDSPDGYFSYYKVSKTILADYKISFALLPLKGSDPTVTLTGEAYPRRLLLVRSGTNHGYKWHYKVSLEREDYLLPRIHAVKHASAQFHVQPEH